MEPKIERIVLAVGLMVVLVLSWLEPLEIAAKSQIDAGFKRALASYAVARTLNAVISVAQGTEVSIAPLGTGINFALGQILDPVNDMVEQFSDLMLAALVAFGVMKISITMGSFWLFSLFLTAVAVGWTWFRWRGQVPPPILTKILFMLLFVRFAIPLVTIGSDFAFNKFLADEYTKSHSAIELSSAKIDEIKATENDGDNAVPDMEAVTDKTDFPTTSPSETIPAASAVGAANQAEEVKPGLWTKIKSYGATAVNKVGKKADSIWTSAKDKTLGRIERIKELASQIVEHLVRLMVVFLLQTILIPLVLLWALLRIGRSAIN